ncbi:MAG: hypothetical protein JST14_03715 [Bacteroidetes bacterium]|nr:hypothetical protein [Bacteroidota bacterium]MBS1979456.1 hypothetical protein [Bacteroidota bacterium]
MKFADILNAFRTGSGTARSHMKNLLEMAATDGHFQDVEYELLKSIAKENGISESELKEIQKNPQGIKFEVPQDKKVKFTQLYDLVHMMSVDNNIHPDELKLAHLFAIKFGYPSAKAKELVDTITQNIRNKLPASEAIKRAEMMLM